MSKEEHNNLVRIFPKFLWLIPVTLLCFLFFKPNSNHINNPSQEPVSKLEAKLDQQDPVNRKGLLRDESFSVLNNKKELEWKIEDYPHFNKNLQIFPDYYKEFLIKYTDNELIEKLEKSKTLEDAVIILAKDVDPSFKEKELISWLDECEFDFRQGRWAGKRFYELSPETRMGAIATYLIKEKGFKYTEKVKPDSYNIGKVLQEREGLCSTLPVIFTLICERLNEPVFLVTSDRHVFCRFDNGKETYNIESTSPYAMGVGTPDSFYLKDQVTGEKAISDAVLENTTTMKTLNLRQSISVLLLNSSAALSEGERLGENYTRLPAKNEQELLNDLKYASSAFYFNPKSYLPIRNVLTLTQQYRENFNPTFVYAFRSLAIRTGIIKPQEDDLRLIKVDIDSFKEKYEELVKKYDVFDTTNKELVQKVIKETSILYMDLSKYMKANKYVLSDPLEKDLSKIKMG